MSTISRIWGRFPAAPTLLLPCLGRAAGRLGAIRFPGALSWLLVSAFLTGCAVVPSHIHDDTNAQTAKKAEDAMAAFSSNAPAIYGAMSANLELFKAEEDYVTSELDAGPIIEQDVIRIDHSDSPDDMLRYGKDIEKTVLARGLRYHLEDRVLMHGNKTVVFR